MLFIFLSEINLILTCLFTCLFRCGHSCSLLFEPLVYSNVFHLHQQVCHSIGNTIVRTSRLTVSFQLLCTPLLRARSCICSGLANQGFGAGALPSFGARVLEPSLTFFEITFSACPLPCLLACLLACHFDAPSFQQRHPQNLERRLQRTSFGFPGVALCGPEINPSDRNWRQHFNHPLYQQTTHAMRNPQNLFRNPW